MSLKLVFDGVETETELTDVEALDIVVERWVGTEIPSSTTKFSQLNSINALDFSDLLVSQQGGFVHSPVGVILGVLVIIEDHFFLLLFGGLLFLIINFLVGDHADTTVWHPLIHSTVDALVVDVVLVGGLNFLLGGIVI